MASKTEQQSELRKRRIAANMTLLEAADLLGISEGMMSLLETGNRQPGKALMVRIRDAFGIEIEEWFRHVA